MSQELATIGYEAADIEDFIATLKIAGIELLIDVRDVAVSRRKGFSKTALSNALEANDISYLHLRGLGDPKDGREAARRGDFDTFRKIFNTHMKSEKALVDLKTAISETQQYRACLMCYERDPANCHRTIVANTISEQNSFKIRPLGVKAGIADGKKKVRKRKSSNASQSIAACG